MSGNEEKWAHLLEVLKPQFETSVPNGPQMKLQASTAEVFWEKGPVVGDVYRDKETGQWVAIDWRAGWLCWTRNWGDPDVHVSPNDYLRWTAFPSEPRPGHYPWRDK